MARWKPKGLGGLWVPERYRKGGAFPDLSVSVEEGDIPSLSARRGMALVQEITRKVEEARRAGKEVKAILVGLEEAGDLHNLGAALLRAKARAWNLSNLWAERLIERNAHHLRTGKPIARIRSIPVIPSPEEKGVKVIEQEAISDQLSANSGQPTADR